LKKELSGQGSQKNWELRKVEEGHGLQVLEDESRKVFAGQGRHVPVL
jgi:hypothetical protein